MFIPQCGNLQEQSENSHFSQNTGGFCRVAEFQHLGVGVDSEWGVREGGTKGTTATESLDVSVTLPVSTMTHWHAYCFGCSPALPLPSQRLLSQTTALFERIQKQTTCRGGPREKQNHRPVNLLSRRPPLLSAQMVAAREPRCYWKNLVRLSRATKQKSWIHYL